MQVKGEKVLAFGHRKKLCTSVNFLGLAPLSQNKKKEKKKRKREREIHIKMWINWLYFLILWVQPCYYKWYGK
jgi:hypothetical protein